MKLHLLCYGDFNNKKFFTDALKYFLSSLTFLQQVEPFLHKPSAAPWKQEMFIFSDKYDD